MDIIQKEENKKDDMQEINEHPKKKYNQINYNKKFNGKNKEKIKKKHTCDICFGSYTYYNKSKHLKSKRHILFCNKNNL